MIKDHHYNLLSQLVTEHRSLWRVQKYYLKNARGCQRCVKFYRDLLKTKAQIVEDLRRLLKEHKLV